MEERTELSFLAVSTSWTHLGSVDHWMIFEFFPSMALGALVLDLAALVVVQDEVLRFPI
jgi:hypothetical protein